MFLQKFSNQTEFIEKIADDIVLDMNQKPGIFHWGLSGGSTPRPVYEALARNPELDWSRVELWQIDERYVSADSADSNLKLIRDSFGEQVLNQVRKLHFFDTTLSISDCLKKYSAELSVIAESGFNLALLGIGPDGHTASLFPHSPALSLEQELTAHTQTEQFAVSDRLTVTFNFLLKSQKLAVLLRGADKEPVLAELAYGQKTNTEFPAKELLTRTDLEIYFLS